MRFIRESVIITPPPTGRQPPARLVPAPRGTKGTFISLQACTIRTTCSVVVGKTTTSGLFFSMVKPSHSYTSRSLAAVRMAPAPTMSRRRSARPGLACVWMSVQCVPPRPRGPRGRVPVRPRPRGPRGRGETNGKRSIMKPVAANVDHRMALVQQPSGHHPADNQIVVAGGAAAGHFAVQTGQRLTQYRPALRR